MTEPNMGIALERFRIRVQETPTTDVTTEEEFPERTESQPLPSDFSDETDEDADYDEEDPDEMDDSEDDDETTSK